MKSKFKISQNLGLIAIAAIIAVGFIGCPTEDPGPQRVYVTGVTVNPKTITGLQVGLTQTITALIEPANADNQTINWSSDKQNVATVEGGVITAVGPGTAIITAASPEGPYDICEVTVVKAGDIPITEAAITITAPATGEPPDTVAAGSSNDNFTIGLVSWDPADDPFKGAQVYIAAVRLEANEDYTFTGIDNVTVNGNAATVESNTGGALTLSYQFPATELFPIAAAAITLTAPAVNAVPSSAATGGTNDNFTIGNVSWNPSHNPFQGAQIYTATVTLTASANYTFEDIPAGNVTINGNAAILVSNTGVAVTLSYQFPATDPAPITTAAITVTAPLTNNVPNTTALGGANFARSAVTWAPNDSPFLADVQYTATVTLTANAGFTFTGLSAATINGETATVTNNTGEAVTLSYQFPATEFIPIATAAITVTAPVIGIAPSTASNATAAGGGNTFTRGLVAWSSASDPVIDPETYLFAEGAEYTATVTLTANAGYTFTGLATATINTQAAQITDNTGGAVTLSYQFPPTAFIPIASAAITVIPPAADNVPSLTASGGNTFTRSTVTWDPADAVFVDGIQYTASITLTANTGYTFTEGLTTATINGYAATVTNNTGNEATLSYQFQAAAASIKINVPIFVDVGGTVSIDLGSIFTGIAVDEVYRVIIETEAHGGTGTWCTAYISNTESSNADSQIFYTGATLGAGSAWVAGLGNAGGVNQNINTLAHVRIPAEDPAYLVIQKASSEQSFTINRFEFIKQ